MNEGDGVPDTNPEAYEATVCQPRQSCSPDLDDPIRKCGIVPYKAIHAETFSLDNLMDYTDDDCRTGFTNGQYDRMKQVLSLFRGYNLS